MGFFFQLLSVSSVVHALRPADIKVVAAIGDSLTVIIHIFTIIHYHSKVWGIDNIFFIFLEKKSVLCVSKLHLFL